MKTYKFLAEMELTEDEWLVRCPTMERYGGFAGGDTKGRAWILLQEILQANIETMLELGMPIPEEPEHTVPLGENQAFIIVRPNLEPASKKATPQKPTSFRQ